MQLSVDITIKTVFDVTGRTKPNSAVIRASVAGIVLAVFSFALVSLVHLSSTKDPYLANKIICKMGSWSIIVRLLSNSFSQFLHFCVIPH